MANSIDQDVDARGDLQVLGEQILRAERKYGDWRPLWSPVRNEGHRSIAARRNHRPQLPGRQRRCRFAGQVIDVGNRFDLISVTGQTVT